MKITKITPQVKKTDRFSIYVDEKYSFSLNEYQLATAGLRIGKEISVQELEVFKNESNFGKAYERTLGYLAIRPRSRRELEDYLRRTFLYPKPKIYIDKKGERQYKKQVVDKCVTQAMIERILQRLEEKRYLNDEAFARAWVASRQLTKKSSTRRLQQELQAKGIDSEIIATVLQNENIDERANLELLVRKKQKLPRYQSKDKLTRYLAGQGFNYDLIKSVLDELAESAD